jgi:hypothetical protein
MTSRVTSRARRAPRVVVLLTAAVGLLLATVGAVVGSFVAGMFSALVLAPAGLPHPLIVAVSVVATTTLLTWKAGPALLRRATGTETVVVRAAIVPLALGAALAALAVAWSAAGGGVVAVLAWSVVLVGGVAAGATLAGRSRRDGSPGRDRGTSRRVPGVRWRHEEGAVSAEHLAIVVVVAAVIAALFSTALPSRVGEWGSYAACSLFGGECERPGDGATAAGSVDPSWAPDSCMWAARDRYVEAALGITWIDLGTRQGYQTRAMSDGTYEVTYTGSSTVGGSKSAGVWLEIHAGEESFASGASASAGAALRFEDGLSWEFTSEQEAADWIDWHLREGLVPEMVDNPVTRIASRQVAGPLADQLISGGRDSLFGRAWSAGNRAVDWGLEKVGLSQGPPATPEVTEQFVAGGAEFEAYAELGYLFAGDTRAGFENMSQLGTSFRSNGEQVVYLEIETELLVSAGLNLGPEAQAGYFDRSVVAVTLDEANRPTQVDLQVHRQAEAGRDLRDLDDPRQLLAGSWSADASGEPLAPSLYQIDATLALDPDRYDDLGDVLKELGSASGAAVPGRPGGVTDRLLDEGRVSVVEYADLERRYGGNVGGAFSAEISGALAVGDRQLDAVAAHFFDRDTDAFRRFSCADAG